MMEQDGLSRGQKLVLGVMSLSVVAVLVALGLLIRGSSHTSPLPTIGSAVARTPVTTRADATTSPNAPVQASPTPPPHEVAVEILAARRIEGLAGDVGQIRELPKQEEIALNFLDDQDVAAYLRRIRADSVRRASLERQQALLAALDLLPDPEEAFPPPVQTRAGQLVAFYDLTEGQIFVAPRGRDGEPPDISFVHQYAHAVIGQHFDLLSLIEGAPNADAARARDALMEGDATAALALHSFGGVEQADVDDLSRHLSEVEVTDYEGYLTSRAMEGVFESSYRDGARFVGALLQAGWWPAVNAAYLDPPDSTEQVLHPEKYLDTPRDVPQRVRLPYLGEDLGEGWRLVGQDVLGELVLRAHLDQFLPSTPEAHAAAAGWDGDLAALWHDLEGERVLVMRILWDSAAEAAEFARSYVTVVDRRLRGARIVVRPILPAGAHWWRGEAGNAYLQRDKDAVLVVWAPDTDTMERVLAVLVFSDE